MRMIVIFHATILGLAAVLMATQTTANTITIDKMLELDASQFANNTVSNDTWMSGELDLGKIVSLDKGDMFIFNLTLKGGKVKMNDGFFNGSESIKIQIDGEGGAGGAPNNKFDYEFTFTGVEGGPLLVNPVKGEGTMGALNGNVDLSRNIDLINGGMVSFADVHLKITNKNPNRWSFDKVGVGVDADDVSLVPLPAGILLLGTALAGLGLTARRGTS